MKRVLIELEKIRSPYHGLGNYGRNLGAALNKLCKQRKIKPIFYLPNKQNGLFGLDADYTSIQKWHRLLPYFAPKADLWHIIHQDSAYWPPRKHIPLILTIHDLNFIHVNKTQKRIAAHLRRINKLIQRASLITTISKYSKSEIEQYCQPNIPIEIIYNGVEMDLTKERKPIFIKDDQPFLLALGEVSAKKNFHVLVDLIAKLPNYILYIVGKLDDHYAQKIKSKAQAFNIQDQIRLTGPVSESEKIWFYKNCQAFLFPSLTEGFGLPVIEAMRCGKPVFISNKTALPEIGGEDAYYFHHYSSDHMLDVFMTGMQDYVTNKEKAHAIQQWSKQFNWQTAAEQYLQLYEQFLS